MHGRKSLLALLLIGSLAGCRGDAAPAVPAPSQQTALPGVDFEAAQTGTSAGIVRWEGDVPVLPSWRFPTGAAATSHAHPHLPLVDAQTAGLHSAVVYLRGVEPRRVRPWSHGPVRVEHRDRELTVQQDGQGRGVGFVRQGDEIEVVSHDAAYHCLRGRGASFFALPLPEADSVSRRRLDQNGVVELGSAAGYPWIHAHLFVDEHPYYARSDAHGAFALDQVPAGRYELVCWLPSWVVVHQERDPESALATRLAFAPPCEQRQTVVVEPGRTTTAGFTWSRRRIEK